MITRGEIYNLAKQRLTECIAAVQTGKHKDRLTEQRLDIDRLIRSTPIKELSEKMGGDLRRDLNNWGIDVPIEDFKAMYRKGGFIRPDVSHGTIIPDTTVYRVEYYRLNEIWEEDVTVTPAAYQGVINGSLKFLAGFHEDGAAFAVCAENIYTIQELRGVENE